MVPVSSAAIPADSVAAATDALALHASALVIDATCPLARLPHYLDWWMEGGATAIAPTLASTEGLDITLATVAQWLRLTREDPRLRLVRTADDIEQAKASEQLGIIFHFQGLEAFGNDLDLIDLFAAAGVRMVQLTYNTRNRAGSGCEVPDDDGLTAFGAALVDRLHALRLVVDCSHTGEQTSLDAIARTPAGRPVVISHANPRALRPGSTRAVSDDLIRAIAATGGLVGTVGFPAFVSDDPRPTLDAFIDHIVYIADLVGIQHTGLGIDYFTGQAGVADDAEAQRIYDDAISSGVWTRANYPPPPFVYPAGIETPRTLPALTARLLQRGFSAADTRLVLGENWLRVFREVWGA